MTAQSLLRETDPLDDFIFPEELGAAETPEMRGLSRDGVRLMVANAGGISHRRFHEIADEIDPGDLLVVNNSMTLPAAVDISESLVVHFSTELPGGLRVVEVRRRTDTGSEPNLDMTPGGLDLPDGSTLELLAAYPVNSPSHRLWVAHIEGGDGVGRLLEQHGQPITYSNATSGIPISAYQTVFATAPGSAEMPSAGRPFSPDLVTSLVSGGIAVVPVTLHTGVSSLEKGEPPYPEWYSVPDATAELINATRRRGNRVIAVGTTVVRALETVTDRTGRAHEGSGWTDLVIGANTPIRGIDGMITGWHEPRSTHLDMLVAVAGRDVISRSYQEALRPSPIASDSNSISLSGYLWHEFGDSHLILTR